MVHLTCLSAAEDRNFQFQLSHFATEPEKHQALNMGAWKRCQLGSEKKGPWLFRAYMDVGGGAPKTAKTPQNDHSW